MSKTFVGFGFGPIQSGLFLFEAWQSGNFDRYVVAEVNPALVRAVRENGGAYELNVACKDRIVKHTIRDVELYDPSNAADREKLIEAIAESDEMATCLPSVRFYNVGEETSVVKLLSAGLARREPGKPVIIYASENNNHAAEIFTEALAENASPEVVKNVQVLNTVIGKMSGIISEDETIEEMKLERITPKISHAILVEEFNRILISRIELPGYERGIECFDEKADLLPFEEAKLYGHNAIHALLAYLSDMKALATIAEAGNDPELMAIARRAFVDESGVALCARYKDLGDPLFTPAGYAEYADDLLERMVCPNLHDLVGRVGRDHLRKLGYDDRLFGTMRIAMEYGVEPKNLALGAAAGIASMICRADELSHVPELLPKAPNLLTPVGLFRLLSEMWGEKIDDKVAEKLIDMTWDALDILKVS